MPRIEKIKQILIDRKIEFLLHFTQLENLPSILEHGLKPKDNLTSSAKCNDNYRHDGHTDKISLSIHHPNDAMFFKYRSNDSQVDWCILVIPATILLNQEALFCNRNAASSSISIQSKDELRKSAAFNGMFDEIEGIPSRKEQFLKSFDPTDVQGEVLLKGQIEPDMIKAIVFTSSEADIKHRSIIGDRKTFVHSGNSGFLSRHDYLRRHY